MTCTKLTLRRNNRLSTEIEVFIYTDRLLINALYYLLAAVIAVPLFKKIGLGSILGYLCADIVLGHPTIGVMTDADQVLHFGDYGIIFLLFTIGLELAAEKLWNMRSHIGLTGLRLLALRRFEVCLTLQVSNVSKRITGI